MGSAADTKEHGSIGTKEHGWKIDVEYQGNQTFCTFCCLLGHTVRLCRKKAQIQGKSVVENKTKSQSESTNKNIRSIQWIAKNGATQATTSKNNVVQQVNMAPKGILKRPEEGINATTKKALFDVGLLTKSETNLQDTATSSMEHADIAKSPVLQDNSQQDNPERIFPQEIISITIPKGPETLDTCLKPTTRPEDTKASGKHTPDQTQGIAVGNQTRDILQTKNQFGLLENLDEEEHGGDKEIAGMSKDNSVPTHASESDNNQMLDNRRTDYGSQEGTYDMSYSQSDRELNNESRHKRKQYQKRRIMSSDPVTRSVAKNGSSTNTV